MHKPLSPREEEIVELCVEGLTNEGIALRLGLSVGTINTYWLRIKLKVGGLGRTDTVARIIKDRAERALREANVELSGLADIIAEREHSLLEFRATLALFQLAMEQIKSTVWATDLDLIVHVIANGEFPSTHFGIEWAVGKTIYEMFGASNSNNDAVNAHLSALEGHESSLRLCGAFETMVLRVIPLYAETDTVMGVIGILNSVGGDQGIRV